MAVLAGTFNTPSLHVGKLIEEALKRVVLLSRHSEALGKWEYFSPEIRSLIRHDGV
jgi:hypothetical protein